MKICMYFNIPSLYRERIYREIDNKYNCEWYFEDQSDDIKSFDTNLLRRCSRLKIKSFKGMYWTRGLLGLLHKDYDKYIMIGATRNLSLYVFLFLKCLFYRKKKVFLWTHGYYGKESWTELNLFKRPLFKMADGLLLYGNYARELMIKDGFNSKHLYTIHNSLAYDKQLALRKQIKKSDIYSSHFGNNHPVLLFLGRLTKVKKLEMILEAVAKLKAKNEYYNVALIGDGVQKKSLEELAASLKLEKQIWFYGACYDEAKNAELVYNADLCVAPGNIGLTVIHTLMFGCPAITHGDFKWQMPEFESIHPGETGDFFERDNIDDLVAKISSWFQSSRAKREEIRKACYKEIDEQWNPDFQISVLEKALN